MLNSLNLNNISSEEFEIIFDQILDEKISDDSIKSFLLNLNAHNLPLASFLGSVASLKKRMITIDAPENAIDVCGTGGDQLNTLNISTAVAFVVAGAGVPVAKHGNRAISSLSGSADIFDELGIKFSEEKNEIEKNLREKNLCFLYAPLFHKSLKNLAKIRKSIGTPTIFNFLGPILNPANTKSQLIGTSRRDTMIKIITTIANQSENRAYVVHGFDGMDEITLTDNSNFISCENGKIFDEEIINPKDFGFELVSPEDLKGKDPKYNAERLVSLLEGEKSAYREIVILNSAFALKLAKKVKRIEEGIDVARSAIDSKRAKNILGSFKS